MTSERVKDVLDWKSDRVKEIIKGVCESNFRIIILGSQDYMLGSYEIIRVINIIMTSKKIKRSLNNLEKSIWRREGIYDNQLEILSGKKEVLKRS